jgi:hypothetical protein
MNEEFSDSTSDSNISKCDSEFEFEMEIIVRLLKEVLLKEVLVIEIVREKKPVHSIKMNPHMLKEQKNL